MELASIHIYPLKSGAGLSLSSVTLDDLGLANDRRFMIVRPDGRFLTQREHPRLALVRTALEGDGDEAVLRLQGTTGALCVPLSPSGGAAMTVMIWGDEVVAEQVSAEADAWVRGELGVDARLVHVPPSTVRPVDPAYAEGARTGFADGFPLLLVSEASLEDLNGRLARPVPMDRFRPNVVVRGSPAFAEDGWSELRIGEVRLRIVKPCARCVIVTTDQATAARDPEPLTVLASYRRRGHGVIFGQNVVHLSRGTLRVGDRVELV